MLAALRSRLRVTRGLRFRLTLTYLVFFTVLLVFLGLLFRQTLTSLYDGQLHNILTEEWGALRAYLRIEKPKRGSKVPQILYFYDRDDPEEALIVDRLRQVYLLADQHGKIWEIGPKYKNLPVETPEEIRRAIEKRELGWKTKRDAQGVLYLIRTGVVVAEDDRPYFIAIGRSYAEGQRIIDEFTWFYSWLLPVIILSAGVLGWFMAGRALRPVNDLASTAQRITGSNLTSQIPERGSGDELDRLIEAFNRMIERLNASFTQTRQFSTDVSHELRTPLTAIRGQLEVALLAARTPEQYQEAIVNALQDVERLTQTIRALLLLSQAESGQLALQKQVLDLARVAADIVEQFQIPADSARLRLTADLPPSCLIEADRVQIERLLSNLLSNAVKYTGEGGSVHVSLAEPGSQVELTVSDTGVGIPPDHLPHIFDRFYRVPSAGAGGPERGLGLGLSFVSWIVKAHGGTIQVASTPGKGTTFTVRLPAASREAVAELERAAARNHSESPAL